MLKCAFAFLVLGLVNCVAGLASAAAQQVQALKITILSTMLADGQELGEWGFAALVEVDGHRILFDTGAHPDLVLKNARSLDIDLTTVQNVILSHNHSDHVGGLLTLRDAVRGKAPTALARAYVAEGIFYPRPGFYPGLEDNPMIAIKPAYEKTGGEFVVLAHPLQIFPGVWLTGPVPRKYPEHNWSREGKVKTPQGLVEDTVPEDQALIFDTPPGLVALVGCAHAGVINTIDYARTIIRPARLHALVGGIHLFAASDETIKWTAAKLGEFGLDDFIGAHCTGVETVYRFRSLLNLSRTHAVVGAVGASYDLKSGIAPGYIAQ